MNQNNLSILIAKHLKEVFFGENWTAVNLKDTVADISWKHASTKVNSFNTIAALVYHMNYYVTAALKVLKDNKFDSHDKYSFDHPPVQSQEDWEKLLGNVWKDVENLAGMIEQLPDEKLWENFVEEKYGNYCRNFLGIIEHCHYHLGQIVLIKKFLLNDKKL